MQIVDYFVATRATLGALPTQDRIVIERFFDEAGGMQLVLHSPYGGRINRAWGLALRKRFCRSFNFELQAAANEDAIVLSLGETHSFPLDDVARFLSPATARDVLVQALLDAPMFQTRWRWVTNRALAVARRRNGKRVPANIQRMEAEDLVAVVFPDQLACLENIRGEREIPDHPLVRQAIDDCLNEAMDIGGLEELLRRLDSGAVRCVARDVPEPSPASHEIIGARPYAYLDDAPLEERRTRAVFLRRGLDAATAREMGGLDPEAIAAVVTEAWPVGRDPDEVHDALMLLGLVTAAEARRHGWLPALEELAAAGRAARIIRSSDGDTSGSGHTYDEAPENDAPWVAAERWPQLQAVYGGARTVPPIEAPPVYAARRWDDPDEAVRELCRARLDQSGPITGIELAALLALPVSAVDLALLALEAEGFVLRGSFRSGARGTEWCERRLLARIHRRTLGRLRAEIQPVSAADFYRFLCAWQRVTPKSRVKGPEGLEDVVRSLAGFELAAGAWEDDVLGARVEAYDPRWLDDLCLSGRVGWGRLSVPSGADGRTFRTGPLRSSPMTLVPRESFADWLSLAGVRSAPRLTPGATAALDALRGRGALFFEELARATGLGPRELEVALGELCALGFVTADSFAGLRALLLRGKRPTRRVGRPSGIARAGRWSLLRESVEPSPLPITDEVWGIPGGAAVELQARTLLRRYGIVFRALLERESVSAPWRDLARIYRRLEARGEIRGGRFVTRFTGEQFALPDAVGALRAARREPAREDIVALSGADPLNLVGILDDGPKLAATAGNRIILCDGRPIAVVEGGALRELERLPPAITASLHESLTRARPRGARLERRPTARRLAE